MDIPNSSGHVNSAKMAAILLPVLMLMSTLVLEVACQAPEVISGEYCFLEEFSASCNGSDVIFMASANYGRMKAGKCIQGEVGFLGCSKDILPYMDRICSGRSSCSLTVLKLRDLFSACSKELLSYLDVSYVCQPIAAGNAGECAQRNESRVENSVGVLFSGTAHTTPMGTSACPWFIQALPGQRIKFILYDFTLRDSSRSISSPGMGASGQVSCSASLVVRENSGRRTKMALCNGSDRQKHVYTSATSATHVWLEYQEDLVEMPYFLLSYEAEGCPNFEPPENMWVTVDLDIATIVCNFTGETWYLICRGTSWIGELGNCTKGEQKSPSNPLQSDFPWGILIAVGIGVAIGTVVGLGLLGLVFLCRRCICPSKKKPAITTQEHSLAAREVPPMNELIRSATVMAKQGDPRASQAYETHVHAQPHPYTTHNFSAQVEYHPQGPAAAREQEHIYESYIYKDGTIRSRKDSATESTGSGYCEMDLGSASSIGDFPIGPPMTMPPPDHVMMAGPSTAHPVGGAELDK